MGKAVKSSTSVASTAGPHHSSTHKPAHQSSGHKPAHNVGHKIEKKVDKFDKKVEKWDKKVDKFFDKLFK